MLINNRKGCDKRMKKRIISMTLVLTLLSIMTPYSVISAAKKDDIQQMDAQEQSFDQESRPEIAFSEWALGDLLIGDTYGVYPMSWYETSMIKPIRLAQVKVLLSGLRNKLIQTDCVKGSLNKTLFVKNDKITVEDVIEAIYSEVLSFDYTKDVEFSTDAVTFMTKRGIYTGKNGEQGLNDVCTIEQACVLATRTVTYMNYILNSGSKGFFWEVSNGDNKVYLLGSIHLAEYQIYPFGNKIWEAFHSSDALVCEADILKSSASDHLAELAVYQDGTTLKDHLSQDLYDLTIETLKKLNLPVPQLVYYKPWFIWNLLSALSTVQNANEAATAVSLGIDRTLITSAYIYGKPVLEIEGSKMQYTVMDNFSSELQEYLLSQQIKEYQSLLAGEVKKSKETNNLKSLLEYWKKGDIDKFKEIYNIKDEMGSSFGNELTKQEKAFYDEFYDALLTKRDKGMANYIDNLLINGNGKTYFVVVGSGHYISDNNVLDILIEKGYVLKRIN